jgi:hypothetical protein
MFAVAEWKIVDFFFSLRCHVTSPPFIASLHPQGNLSTSQNALIPCVTEMFPVGKAWRLSLAEKKNWEINNMFNVW